MSASENPGEPDSAVDAACRALAEDLVSLGRTLFVAGALLGPDRVDGRTQFGYGDDRTVGLATVVEIAGDLSKGAIRLLAEGHPYSAAALLRQIIEVEYLVWLFANDTDQARRWLNADDSELRRMFRPGEIRRQSQGRFDGDEYHYHCGWGGHPTPHARYLLTDHSLAEETSWLRDELQCHLRRLWAAKCGVNYAEKPTAAVIMQFDTMEELRGLGLGTLLVAEAERRIRRRGMQTAELGVELHNQRARALYERLGYVFSHEEDTSWDYEDASGARRRYVTRIAVLQKHL